MPAATATVYKVKLNQGTDNFWHAKMYSRNGNILFITPQAEQYTYRRLQNLCRRYFPTAKVVIG